MRALGYSALHAVEERLARTEPDARLWGHGHQPWPEPKTLLSLTPRRAPLVLGEEDATKGAGPQRKPPKPPRQHLAVGDRMRVPDAVFGDDQGYCWAARVVALRKERAQLHFDEDGKSIGSR